MSERADPMADGDETVTAAHGAGGERMRELLSDAVVPRFRGDSPADGIGIDALDDGAVLPTGDGALVVTTDSHVVDPPFFAGGDVGRLAVAGTVNDLAAMGATEPETLTCGLVVEAGTPTAAVESVLGSMAETASAADAPITTGDTKVMPRGDLDGIVVNTAGVARIEEGAELPVAGLSPGDRLLVTGPVGDHGVALLAERESFGFDADLESDVAPVNDLVAAAVDAGTVTAATDPTRGGVATALVEFAERSGVGVRLDERAVPVDDATETVADVLGLDPLKIACEGRMVLGVDEGDAEDVLSALRAAGGTEAALVGRAVAEHGGRVVVDTGIGERYLTEPSGEQRPRIC
ncbi:hydrogenase expression/formation protein HypE [Natronomonas sp.]|uniref:hydrogenase expression/formation protein HypE n=1 Tax=Natronomonas sp. TaxID=2184060 RepID=UPI00261E489D|nr:hydrogenase expression/formation protein HypE [Natronomonas sp.]